MNNHGRPEDLEILVYEVSERVRAEVAKQGRPANLARLLLLTNGDSIVRQAQVVPNFVAERKFPVDKYTNVAYESYYPDMYVK